MNNHDYSTNTSRLSVPHPGLPPTAPGERIRIDEVHRLTPVSDTTRRRMSELLRHTREDRTFPSDRLINLINHTED